MLSAESAGLARADTGPTLVTRLNDRTCRNLFHLAAICGRRGGGHGREGTWARTRGGGLLGERSARQAEGWQGDRRSWRGVFRGQGDRRAPSVRALRGYRGNGGGRELAAYFRARAWGNAWGNTLLLWHRDPGEMIWAVPLVSSLQLWRRARHTAWWHWAVVVCHPAHRAKLFT
jgi:hypothetical protein